MRALTTKMLTAYTLEERVGEECLKVIIAF